MSSRTLAGSLGLEGDWNLGEDNWKDGMDSNLLRLSVLAKPVAIDLVSATPGAPAEGDVYLFAETHLTHANAVAVYDEGIWTYITPEVGWLCYDIAGVTMRLFDGTSWGEFSSGGGGGGGGVAVTPAVIRGSGIQSSSSASYTVNFPAGTLAGDRAVIFVGHAFGINVPTGWSALDDKPGTNWGGTTITRVLTATDIATGSVNVTTGGAFNGVVAIVTFVGATGGIRLPAYASRNASGAASRTLATDGSPVTSDMVIAFGSNRNASANTISYGVSLQTVNATAASGALSAAAPAISGSGLSATFNYGTSTGTTGDYQVVLVVEGVSGVAINLSEVTTQTATSANLNPVNAGKYQRWTNAAAKTLTVQPQSSVAQPDNGEWHIRNAGAANLTLVAGSGVTINAPAGGTLIVPLNGTVTLKRAAADVFDLMGLTT